MFEPQSLNLGDFPWLPLSARAASRVYFAIDAQFVGSDRDE